MKQNPGLFDTAKIINIAEHTWQRHLEPPNINFEHVRLNSDRLVQMIPWCFPSLKCENWRADVLYETSFNLNWKGLFKLCTNQMALEVRLPFALFLERILSISVIFFPEVVSHL